MASEPSKSSASVAQDPQVQPHPIAPYPPQFNGAHYPQVPPGAYPPYYAYAPIPTDSSHDPNVPNGVPPGGPYLMAFPPPPPGMVYAYAPPPGQLPGYPPFAPGLQNPVILPRPKRKQVKMACTNCASACKRCDDARPCERCQKYGIADACVDGVRKERKKGIKRGPYKRKNKGSSGDSSFSANQTTEGNEATMPPVPYAAPPEGYYPYYYPHPGFVPVPAEGHPNGESPTPNGNGHPVPPHPSFYPMHPAVFPPYPPYGHPGPVAFAPPPMMQLQPPPPPGDQQQHAQAKSAEQTSNGNAQENGDAPGMSASKNNKKKRRASKGDENGVSTSSTSKGKKPKNGNTEAINVTTTNGVDE